MLLNFPYNKFISIYYFMVHHTPVYVINIYSYRSNSEIDFIQLK